MESFGRYLRAEREAREVSIDDLSRVTKINRQILQFIETDDFEKLPPPVFVRGFVRAISKTLGLAPEEFVRRYDDYVATHGPQAPGPAAPLSSAPPKVSQGQGMEAPRRSFGRAPFFAGIAFLVVALVLGYRLAAKKGAGAPKRAAKEEKSEPVLPRAEPSEAVQNPPQAAGGIAPEEAGMPEAPPKGGIDPAAKPPLAPAPASLAAPARVPADGSAALGSHTVFLRAKGACWVQLTSDAEPPKEYILQLNETISQKYEKTLTLRAGNPVNLSFDWEGKHYEILAAQARPMRWDFPLSAQAVEKLEELNNPAAAQTGAPPAKPPPKPPVAVPPTGAPPSKPPAPGPANASGAAVPESAGEGR